MQAINIITGTAAVLNVANIDTDQIIPAEHLKITDKAGLGRHLFANWRYHADGSDNAEFVLNQASTRQARILIAGDNFGCGSSREHAPWALVDYGIRVVISCSIADIFRNNSLKNGLLPIVVTPEEHAYLLGLNGQTLTVDVASLTIQCETRLISFQLEPFARYCFLNGMDQLDFLLSHVAQIDAFESQRHNYV